MNRIENYVLQSELGRGATAKVFLATDRNTQEQVSLKVFHPKLFQQSGFTKRVVRELNVMASLAHPNIVQVKKLLPHTDPPAMAMEYVDGDTLETWQPRLPYMLPEISVSLLLPILSALEHAHSKKIIHRDLKPSNILINKKGHVYVMDFGLARIQGDTTITQPLAIVGSPDFMSPEQCSGTGIDKRSDLFSLSAILYYLTTGTHPFSRDSTMATLNAIQTQRPEAPHKRNPKISSRLSKIIMKGLEKDPLKRFQSAQEMKAELRDYLAHLDLLDIGVELATWINDRDVTRESLRVASAALIRNCEQYLKSNQLDLFLEELRHLSTKAPESAAIPRLMNHYQKRKSRKRNFYWYGAAALLFCFAFGFSWFQSRTDIGPTPANEMGTVEIKASPDMKVYWDGYEIDPSRKLIQQEIGEHFLRVERKGFDTVTQKIRIKKGETAVINIQ